MIPYCQTEHGELFNGDCIEVMKQLEDNSIDCCVTSPPYDNLRNYKGFSFDFENTAKELYRIIKKGGIVVWVVGDATINGSETGTSFKQALYFKEIGFNLHDTMIYQKNGFPFPSNNRYYQCFEYMFILSKGKPKTVNLLSDRPNLTYGRKDFISSNRQKDGSCKKTKSISIKENGVRYNIWKYEVGWGKSYKEDFLRSHSAIFPYKLAEDHILTWSNENDIIFDPFCGSGTVALMAEKLNRKWIGIEISKEYCEIIKKRLSLNETALPLK